MYTQWQHTHTTRCIVVFQLCRSYLVKQWNNNMSYSLEQFLWNTFTKHIICWWGLLHHTTTSCQLTNIGDVTRWWLWPGDWGWGWLSRNGGRFNSSYARSGRAGTTCECWLIIMERETVRAQWTQWSHSSWKTTGWHTTWFHYQFWLASLLTQLNRPVEQTQCLHAPL